MLEDRNTQFYNKGVESKAKYSNKGGNGRLSKPFHRKSEIREKGFRNQPINPLVTLIPKILYFQCGMQLARLLFLTILV